MILPLHIDRIFSRRASFKLTHYQTKSFIDYTFCRLQPVAAIERSVANGAAHVQPNASDEVIQRIVDGARKTRQISGFVISVLDG